MDSSSDSENYDIEQERRKPLYKPRINFDLDNFQECFRLSRIAAQHVMDIVGQYLEPKVYKNFALSPKEQVLLTLRFLATGGLYTLVGDAHGPHKSTVCRKIRSVIQLINDHIWPVVVDFPKNLVELASNAQKFKDVAGIPSVLGCLDGTHVRIKPPSDHEQSFVNRYQQHSINCLMVCGPDFKFYYVSAKWPGSVHDARVMRNSTLYQKFESGWRPFPNAILLADSAYQCREWCIPPFDPRPRRQLTNSETRFNAAHRKTRRIIENAFGILKQRFRCLLEANGVLRVERNFASEIIIACTALHNLMVNIDDENEVEPILVDDWNFEDEHETSYSGNLRMQQLIRCFDQ